MVRGSSSSSSSKCKYCGATISARVERLKKHLNRCGKFKVHDDAEKWSNSSGSSYDSDVELSRVSDHIAHKRKRVKPSFQLTRRSHQPGPSDNQADVEPTANSYKKRVVQQPITKFTVHTSEKEKLQIDIALANFFYGCGIPFAVADAKLFTDAIQMLRPGYTPPNRRKMAGELLDKVHDDLLANAKSHLQGKTVTLMQDGWSSIHNEPVLANCISSGKESYFVSSVETKSHKKNSDYCLSVAKEAKAQAEEMYGCKVRSFVSDNEAKMKKMREVLAESHKEENFVSYGCAAHYLNLAGQDISKRNTSILKQVVEVQKYFRNHHVPGALLKEYDGAVKPQIPNDTRWNSQQVCLETYIKNREFYLKILDDNENEITQNVIDIINNVNLHKEVRHLMKQLEPLHIALDKLQSDSATISDAVQLWLGILKNDLLEPYRDILKSRYHASIESVHKLAYMMDTRYRGMGLEEDEKEEARQYLLKVNPEFLPLLVSFEAEDQPFPSSLFEETALEKTHPSTWWKSMKKCKNIDQQFVAFISHLMSCPASSASIERIFSNFSFIINKLRNRLGIEKAAKLVMIYKVLNVNSKTACDEW